MDEPFILPEPLKSHPRGTCTVCGEELPFDTGRLCEDCQKTLRKMERLKWLGAEGPQSVFFGMSSKKVAVGICLSKDAEIESTFPLAPQVHKETILSWGWNPETQRMESLEPKEDVCWLFWMDRDNKEIKSKVFWGACEAIEYMRALQGQDHIVTKAGIKIFEISGGG